MNCTATSIWYSHCLALTTKPPPIVTSVLCWWLLSQPNGTMLLLHTLHTDSLMTWNECHRSCLEAQCACYILWCVENVNMNAVCYILCITSLFSLSNSCQHAQRCAHSMCNTDLLLQLRPVMLLWWCHQRNMFMPLLKCVLRVLRALGLMLRLLCFSFMRAVMAGSEPSLWECILKGIHEPHTIVNVLAAGHALFS